MPYVNVWFLYSIARKSLTTPNNKKKSLSFSPQSESPAKKIKLEKEEGESKPEETGERATEANVKTEEDKSEVKKETAEEDMETEEVCVRNHLLLYTFHVQYPCYNVFKLPFTFFTCMLQYFSLCTKYSLSTHNPSILLHLYWIQHRQVSTCHLVIVCHLNT